MDQALDKVKIAMRIMTSEFDGQITGLISAGLADLGIAGVVGEKAIIEDPLVLQAVTSYCQMYFGESDQYDRHKAAYDEQKAQLSMHTGYTVWGLNG